MKYKAVLIEDRYRLSYFFPKGTEFKLLEICAGYETCNIVEYLGKPLRIKKSSMKLVPINKQNHKLTKIFK